MAQIGQRQGAPVGSRQGRKGQRVWPADPEVKQDKQGKNGRQSDSPKNGDGSQRKDDMASKDDAAPKDLSGLVRDREQSSDLDKALKAELERRNEKQQAESGALAPVEKDW